jgi:1-acyl-sn-glycerol-3-phosphate acyltransferase
MMAAALASMCRLISGVTVEWHCDPRAAAQRIYFGNHSSHLDFVVIWSVLPPDVRERVRPVAGRDYWDRGALRRYVASRIFRAVLVERGCPGSVGAASARASVDHMAREMGTRDSLIVFPEGTRSLDGEVGPFKSGLYHLARARPDAELIPVRLENLNRILPKGEALPVPMLSRITFETPLRVTEDESKEEFLARARSALLHRGAEDQRHRGTEDQRHRGAEDRRHRGNEGTEVNQRHRGARLRQGYGGQAEGTEVERHRGRRRVGTLVRSVS